MKFTHKKSNKNHGNNEMFPMHNNFNHYKKGLRWFPLLFLLLTLIISSVLYKYYAISVPGVLIAVIISIMILREIATLIFATRIHKRILTPMEELTDAFEMLSKGDYGYQINNSYVHQMKRVIDSFNEMSKELESSQRIKEKYDKNQKELIAGISHDLKSPMTSIIGYLEGIEEGVADTPEKMSTYLNVIYSNALYSNKLIDDLFLTSKLDLNELKFDKTNINAKLFFEDVFLEKKLEYEQSIFDYKVTISENTFLMIDTQLFIRVLNNIYDNAEKYNDKDRCKIFTEVTVDEQVRILIRDNGSGIANDNLEKIFSKFYRIDASRNKEVGGSGLGLSIAKEIIEKHDGSIEARNTDNGFELIMTLGGVTHE